MAIRRYFNQSIRIRRLKVTSGYKERYTSTGTIDCHIQRIQNVETVKIYGVDSASHECWVDISDDIREGDQVEDYSGNVYSVVGVSERGRDIAMNEHKEVILDLNTS